VKLIDVELEGLPYEFTEDEAIELYTSLHTGLLNAGFDVEKLKTVPTPKGTRKFNQGPSGTAFFGHWPVQTDC